MKKELDLSPLSSEYDLSLEKVIFVVKLESINCAIYRVRTDGFPSEWKCDLLIRFYSETYIKSSGDSKGTRLLEEISRRVQYAYSSIYNEKPDLIVVTTPGTVRDNKIIARSSRLGITESVNVVDYIESRTNCPVIVLRDTDSRAAGEIYFGEHESAYNVINENLDFAIVMVSQGVGMSLVQNWKITTGAGAAGAIGRLIVEPNGQFNRSYNQRGNLETCIATPWISNLILEEFLTLRNEFPHDKLNANIMKAIDGSTKKGENSCINATLIAEALDKHDPIVLRVMQKASIYLATVLSSIIAINNPNLIILTGDIIEQSDVYFEMIIRETRRLSWGKAWERTVISRARANNNNEVLGAAYLGYKFCQEE